MDRDERCPDVGRAESARRCETLNRDRRATRQVVGASGIDVKRAQHALLSCRRTSAVVNPESRGHGDEHRADVPEAELDPEKMRVVVGLSEQRPDRSEVGRVVHQRDLDSVSMCVHVVHGGLQGALGRPSGRAVGEEHVLQEQGVARRVAVGAGGAGR